MEPRGLVIRWRDVKIHEGPGVVPHTVTVGGHDSESVITGPEAAKESFPTRSRVFPVLVDALQLVTKTRPFRDREAQCRVVDLPHSRCVQEEPNGWPPRISFRST